MINIYVANLAPEMTESELQALFDEFGTVSSAKIIKDRLTGESRGFGFVEMSDKDAGEKAINDLNGKEVNGKQIRVNEARPKTDRRDNRRGGGGFGGGGGGGGRGGDFGRRRY